MVVAGNTITVVETEHLIYDGENDNEALTIIGSSAEDIFVHTPGNAIDAGSIGLTSSVFGTLLGLSYEDLGAAGNLTVSGGVGGISDRLVALGTSHNDAFRVQAVTGRVELVNVVGDHVDLVPSAIEALTLDGLDGDDSFLVDMDRFRPAIGEFLQKL